MSKANADAILSKVVPVVVPFLNWQQAAVMVEHSRRGEESAFFLGKFQEYFDRIQSMPKSYEQDGKGDAATVYLHYFLSGSDWYILERDQDGAGTEQAFGFTILNGDTEMAELGYICIDEITRAGAELDIHWTPQELRAVKIAAGIPVADKDDEKPWVCVANPGEADEEILSGHDSFAEAVEALPPREEQKADVMKRAEDGTLTTEF